MPIFLKREHNRLAFLFGRQTALRATNDVIDQLQKQIEQLKFNAAEYERLLTVLSRQLAFASAASPSAMKH